MLALVSGDNRADMTLIEAVLDEPVERPDAAYVREVTGYAIGGIPPIGHPEPVRTLMDEDLLRFATVWAAAGHPHAVFPIAPQDLATAARASGPAARGALEGRTSTAPVREAGVAPPPRLSRRGPARRSDLLAGRRAARPTATRLDTEERAHPGRTDRAVGGADDVLRRAANLVAKRLVSGPFATR